MDTFGERLRKLRKDMGLNQRNAARKISVNVNQLVRYEIDKSKPSFDLIVRLADFFEVTTDFLIHGNDKRFTERAQIKDEQLLELFRRIDKLNRLQREQIKWAIDSLVCKLPGEEVKFFKLAKSA